MQSKLFNSVLSNPHHVLYHLVLPVKDIGYNLRQRSHCLTLSSEDTNLISKNFLHRMLFRVIYWAFIRVLLYFLHHFTVFVVTFLFHIVLYACCYGLRLSNLIKETTY